MSKPSCDSCQELRENAPEFVMKGVTDGIARSLKNNTGVSYRGSNCEELQDVLDCLVGRPLQEIEDTDVCDWKEFMSKFGGNLYEALKAMLMSDCGLLCRVDYLMAGESFHFGEDSPGESYIVAGKGVSYELPYEGRVPGHTADLTIDYWGGAFCEFNGSFDFFTSNFTDAVVCPNFDNGNTETRSISRLGNSVWGESGELVYTGELIAEFRIKKSEYPHITKFGSGTSQQSGSGHYSVNAVFFDSGTYAFGQHGACLPDGSPYAPGQSRGHLVPAGWMYFQLRMKYMYAPFSDGGQYSPVVVFPVRLNPAALVC